MSAPVGSPVRSGAERTAIDWEVRLRDPAADDHALSAFRKWHDGAPEHAAAWASLQRRLGQMRGHGAGSAVARTLRHPVEERRRALRAGFGMAVLAISGAGGWKLAHELGYDATWRSGIGEHGSATLADGSALRFDAGTRIDLRPAGTRTANAASRSDAGDAGGPIRLHLRQGQLLVRARGELTVALAGAEIDCDGAELCAGRLGRRGIVSVRGGDALLRAGGFAPVALASGDTFTFDDAEAAASPLSFNAAAAWTRGMLVADRLPLPDLAEVFGRHHPGILRVRGTAAAHVISGVFRLADLEGALRQVAGALPVRIERYGMLTIVE